MNSKLREQGKKEEKRRLKEFVENAYRCDPRVIAHKEAQRAERHAPPCHDVPEVCRVVTPDIEGSVNHLTVRSPEYWSPPVCDAALEPGVICSVLCGAVRAQTSFLSSLQGGFQWQSTMAVLTELLSIT